MSYLPDIIMSYDDIDTLFNTEENFMKPDLFDQDSRLAYNIIKSNYDDCNSGNIPELKGLKLLIISSTITSEQNEGVRDLLSEYNIEYTLKS
jgi:hypothetical protein